MFPEDVDPNEWARGEIARRIDECASEMMQMVEAGATDRLLQALRSRGYLILAPTDTSPLAELVRAAVRYEGPVNPDVSNLLIAAFRAAADPVVRQWAERGRDG